MHHELTVITITAASIGLFHTLLGPDHYLPFIVMARSRRWSLTKTTWITILCGTGHVLSSILLGIMGIALGISIKKLETIESFRGEIAAWILIVFGLVYFVWGLYRALSNLPHKHWHVHEDIGSQIHSHAHNKDHLHDHEGAGGKNLTPWVLFTIFVFGPCEPLIPLLIYPAAENSIFGLVLVISVFSVVTIMTMLIIVILLSLGTNLLPMGQLERYTHALAGATICICGISIQFLGL
ncbi:MAG: sulfite exporter TauE/SafE family protein [Candidatus Scalinduaceae bacterium]